MTDLPRFYQGEMGKLDFTHLNEVMRRLDLLLPLVQQAADGGGWVTKEKPMVFPVYAEKTDNTTTDGRPFYDWWELAIVGDMVGWGDENTVDEGATELRQGAGAINAHFGIIPHHPRSDDEPSHDFETGFAIAIALRTGNTNAPSGGVKCLLFPLDRPKSGSAYLIIDGEPTPGTVDINGSGREVDEYPAKLLMPNSAPGSDGFSTFGSDLVLVDMNKAAPNRPTMTGSDPILDVRPFDVGTIFQAMKIAPNKYAFTHLPRFDVVCT